jgi:glycosyltransferase involved in cell wall biosynthesis
MPFSPYPVRIGRLADNPSGAVQPVYAPRDTHCLPGLAAYASRCYQRWGATLAHTRVIAPCSLTSRQKRTSSRTKGDGASSPCRQAWGGRAGDLMTASSLANRASSGSREYTAPVCVLLALRVRKDVRARRVASALADAGYSVYIVNFESDRTLPETESQGNVTLRHVKMPSLFVPARFKPWFLVKMLWMFVLAVRQLIRTPGDVYHAGDLKALLPTYIAARFHRKPLIFESYELPLVEPRLLRWRRLRALSARMIRLLVRRCAGVIVVSPPIAQEMHRQYGGPMPVLLRNVPSYQAPLTSNRLRERLALSPTTRIALYQGNVDASRSLDVLVRAARFLPPEIVLVLMGDGPSKAALEALIAAEGVGERVRLLPAVPYAELLSWTASADLGLILLSPDISLSIRYCLPNKLFEYLMVGVPVLSSALPAVAEVLAHHDVGQVSPSLEPEAIAQAIAAMLADPEGMARRHANALAAARELNWEVEQTSLLDLYKDILHAHVSEAASEVVR